jgi:hypothetical protein
MKLLKFTFLIICLGIFQACEQKKESESLATTNELAENPISTSAIFEEIDLTNPFPGAILEMYTPLYNQKFKPGKVAFEFNIKNYPFAKANSNYQLRLIINSGNPLAFDTPNFNLDLKSGAFRAVAYLVDDQGFALKDFGNFVDRDFRVGESSTFPYSTEPYLAVNKPQNLETFSNNQTVDVDFLVLGGDMKEDNLKVVIKINDWKFETDQMNPIKISNLPKGEYQLIVTLENKNGKEFLGPFSTINKSIVIE